MPAILAWLVRGYSGGRPADRDADAAGGRFTGFFEIPYITWFLLHFCFGGLALIAIVALGLSHLFDAAVVSTLLASLFGYVLGTASAQRAQTSARSQPPPPPATGAAAGTPGTWRPAGAAAPASLAACPALTGQPSWTTGQYNLLADRTSHVYWNGTAWATGDAP
jgi:hypothetical protein